MIALWGRARSPSAAFRETKPAYAPGGEDGLLPDAHGVSLATMLKFQRSRDDGAIVRSFREDSRHVGLGKYVQVWPVECREQVSLLTSVSTEIGLERRGIHVR